MRKLSILLFAAAMAGTSIAAAQSTAGQHSPARSTPAKPASKSSATSSQPATPVKSMTDEEKTVYAVGLSIYQSLGSLNLSPGELTIVKQAITDAASSKPAEDLKVWGPKIQELARTRAAQVAEQQKAASQAYLAKAAAEPGAAKTPSGLVYRELRPGSGASPKATDRVKVNYRGTLVNGTEFDSSYSRNEPAEFALNQVVPCWTEGLQLMKVGGKGQLVCPSTLAYGDQGRPGIPPGATLIFEIELLDIVPGAAQ